MRLTSIPVRLEDRFLVGADVAAIWEEVSLQQPGSERVIVAIDGAPGTGKSELSKLLMQHAAAMRVSAGLIEADLDCLPRAERPANSGLMDWHDDTLIREALLCPGADFVYRGYNLYTKKADRFAHIQAPRRGVLVVEGTHAIEFCLAHSDEPLVAVSFEISNELREQRRAARNVRTGRWKAEEVESRTAAQRGPALDFYGDLRRDMHASSSVLPRELRVYR